MSGLYMEDYIERVARAAAERKGEPVFNGSVDHARVIVGAIFRHAHVSVDILTGHLNPRVYGPDSVVDDAEQFLAAPGCSLRIILEDASAATVHHPLLKRLERFPGMGIRTLPPKLAAMVPFHMIVGDKDSYRFEEDKSKPSAVAAWGDVAGAENLSRIFETVWTASLPASLDGASPPVATQEPRC